MTSPDEIRGLAEHHQALSRSVDALLAAAILPFRIIGRHQWAAPWRREGSRG